MHLIVLMRALKLLHTEYVSQSANEDELLLQNMRSSPLCVFAFFGFFRKQAMNNSLTFLHEAWFNVIPEVLENLELMDRTLVFI